MKILKQIEKTREYLDYIEEHVLNVKRAWLEIQDKCNDMFFIQNEYYEDIGQEILSHDLSKMSEQEFIQYRKAFFSVDGEDKQEISPAWQHHIKNNPHHWENWVTKYRSNTGRPHWVIDCIHMVIDWMAMGYEVNFLPAQQYYEKNKEKIKLPEEAIKLIYEIFERLEN